MMIYNFVSFIELPYMACSIVPLPFKESDTVNMLLVLVWPLAHRKSSKILSKEKVKNYANAKAIEILSNMST